MSILLGLRPRLAALAISVMLAGAAPLRAEVFCPTIAHGSPSLSGLAADARLSFIQEGIRRDAHNARLYAWSWAGLYSGSAVANAIRIPLSGSEARKDAIVATAGSLIGVGSLAFLPLKVMSDQRELDLLVDSAQPGSDRCALLAHAERLLLRDAASEEFGRGPLVQSGNFALNIGLGILMGLGFGHWTPAVIALFSGIAVGEIQIATQPTGAVDLLARYRTGSLTQPPVHLPLALTLIPSIAPGQYSLHLAIHF